MESTPTSMDFVISLLTLDESGEYAFIDGASGLIDKLLDAIFALDDPKSELDPLIKLSCALELELRSPTAAGFLRAVLSSDPRFIAALGGPLESEAPVGLARIGSEEVKAAPKYGDAQPIGSLKAASFVSVVPPHIAKKARVAARR